MRPETKIIKDKLEFSQKVQEAMLGCYSLPECELLCDLICRRCKDINRLAAVKSKTGTTVKAIKEELVDNLHAIEEITSRKNEWLL